MSRIPMVTRTIETTVVTIFAANTDDKSTFIQDVTLPGSYKTEKDIMKALLDVFSDGPVKPISIESISVTKALYGMKEVDFIKNAEKISTR